MNISVIKVNTAVPELQGGQRGSHPAVPPRGPGGTRTFVTFPVPETEGALGGAGQELSWPGELAGKDSPAPLPAGDSSSPTPCPGHIPRHSMLLLLLPTGAPAHASFCLRNSSRGTTPSGPGLLLPARVLDSSDKGTELLQSPVPSACLWRVRSSPSTQLRMPRTSPCLPPSEPSPPSGLTRAKTRGTCLFCHRKPRHLLQGRVQAHCFHHTPPSTLPSSILKYPTVSGSNFDSPGQHRTLHPLESRSRSSRWCWRMHGGDTEPSKGISCGSPHQLTHSYRATLAKQTLLSIPAHPVIS